MLGRDSLGAFAVLIVLATGCASLKSLSAGQVGCPEDEIIISDDSHGLGTRNWTANCRGRTYYCSAHGGGEQSASQVSCKEETPSGDTTVESSAPVAAEGCTYDTQCKGDRICVKGTCVKPAATEAAVSPAPAIQDAQPDTPPP